MNILINIPEPSDLPEAALLQKSLPHLLLPELIVKKPSAFSAYRDNGL